MRTFLAFSNHLPEVPKGWALLYAGLGAWLGMAGAFFLAAAFLRSPLGPIVTTTIGGVAAVVTAGMVARLLSQWLSGKRL